MSARSRVAAWFRRLRRRRAAKRQQQTLLREFVYLDDVSVYSLIASRLGPIAAEFTDTETASLQSELSGTLGANAGVAKSEVTSRIQASQSRGSQVLRKSIVQTTFKELYELEADRLVVRPVRPDESVPAITSVEELRTWLPRAERPWAIPTERLARGALIELEVKLEAEPIFRVSTVMSTMLEIMRESTELAEMAGLEQLGQAQSMGRVLERLLAGLVPVRAAVADYELVEIDDRQYLVHRDVLRQIPEQSQLSIRSASVVGVAEEALFWKDIRRVLFAGSSYRALCRIARTGIQDSWTPIKLADVFEQVVPDFASSLEVFNQTDFSVGTSVGGDHGQYQERMRVAAVSYGQELAKLHGQQFSDEELSASPFVDLFVGDQADGVKARRRMFAAVADHVQSKFGIDVDAVSAAHLRTAALMDAGFDLQGHLKSAPEVTTTVRAVETETFIDVEFVAIYW